VRQIEDYHQMTFITWAEYQRITADCPVKGRHIKDFLCAIPNGGKRNPREAGRLKTLGVTAGMPDILFHLPLNGCPGLFIEMKRPAGNGYAKGQLTQKQKDKINDLKLVGYKVIVAHGCEEAINGINNYMVGNKN